MKKCPAEPNLPGKSGCIMSRVILYYSVEACRRGQSRSGFAPIEESPDCTERGVLSSRKDTADDIPREDQCNRKQTAAGSPTVRVKGWGKSPPGVPRKRRRRVNSSRSKTK